MGVIARHTHKLALESKDLGPFSVLAPFSALIISVNLVVFFLIRFYVLEGFLINRLYGSIYTKMSERDKRGFINHHIAGATKIIILILAAYPFVSIAFLRAKFDTPYAKGSPATLGDILVLVAQMLIGIYIFELLYRSKLSPIAVLHHVGTILIGQSAIAINLRPVRAPDSEIEFILCTVWGAFDIVFEFLPHVAIILYRCYPKRHYFLSRWFLISCIVTATGTLCETMVAMGLFGSLWHKWRLAFKVVTPLLHIAFSAAQLHGSYVFWQMYRRQEQFLKEEKEIGQDDA